MRSADFGGISGLTDQSSGCQDTHDFHIFLRKISLHSMLNLCYLTTSSVAWGFEFAQAFGFLLSKAEVGDSGTDHHLVSMVA